MCETKGNNAFAHSPRTAAPAAHHSCLVKAFACCPLLHLLWVPHSHTHHLVHASSLEGGRLQVYVCVCIMHTGVRIQDICTHRTLWLRRRLPSSWSWKLRGPSLVTSSAAAAIPPGWESAADPNTSPHTDKHTHRLYVARQLLLSAHLATREAHQQRLAVLQ
jgi:hypothetical protein